MPPEILQIPEIPQIIARVLTGHTNAAWHGMAQITPEDDLQSDLGADSLHRITIAVELEEAYRIDIPDCDVASWRTVADIDRTVARLCAPVAQGRGAA